MSDYPAREIEERWQEFWRAKEIYKASELPRRKYYVLDMFAYPSGDMHMGHARNYCIGDVVYRYRRMQGFEVLHPYGWDAFGLPAENAAIAHGSHPSVWTDKSIARFKQSLNLLGLSYDWSREIKTCEPGYYRWNQWLFLKLLERGLAYRKEAYVNWCTGCQTVLANEQVEEGACYRCRSAVEKRKLTQWFLKITEYAEGLLKGLDTLPGWPENVKTMQRNWIGRSEGCEVDFTLEDGTRFPIFTTRADTLFGVTFMALAPDAPLAGTIARGTAREQEVAEFVQRVLKRPEIERIAQVGDKEGIFTGRYATNPLTGDRVPIYIADFVLASYGTGMIMAVPGHDQRDFDFARKYRIPIKVVIQPPLTPEARPLTPDSMTAAYVDEGIMVNSRQFDGTPNLAGIARVTDFLVQQGIGRRVVNYRLKDWLISRQRYWGTPIPVIHCARDGIVPVPEKDLPVILPPEVKDFKPRGKSVLAGVDEFYHTTCPKCKGPAHRDPDTMDTFVDSSWYYIRYTDAHNARQAFAPDKANAWLPIDEYIGGIEHACGHLIFFRFFHKVLHDMGLLATDEPAAKLHTHGMVSFGGAVMSKSMDIGVRVGDLVPKHGADALRLAVLFAAPPEKGMDWQEEVVVGARRFVARIHSLYQQYARAVTFEPVVRAGLGPAEERLYIRLNQTAKKVLDDLAQFQFNTAIAALMEFLNDLTAFESRESPVFGFALGQTILLLAPFAPHLAEELYHQTGRTSSVFDARLPDYDRSATNFADLTIPVQVNGRLRSKLVVARDLPEAEIRSRALADPKVQGHVAGQQVVKVIYVPNRLVNIVTGPPTS